MARNRGSDGPIAGANASRWRAGGVGHGRRPRWYLPELVYEVTIRTLDGTFWLRPDPQSTAIVSGVFGRACRARQKNCAVIPRALSRRAARWYFSRVGLVPSRRFAIAGVVGLVAAGAGFASIVPMRCTVVCDRCVQKFWRDLDLDGYGAGDPVTLPPESCDKPGYATNSDDCDDKNSEVGSRAVCGGGTGLGKDLCRGYRDCAEDGPKALCKVPYKCPESVFPTPQRWFQHNSMLGCDWKYTPTPTDPPLVIQWNQIAYPDGALIVDWKLALPPDYPAGGEEAVISVKLTQKTWQCCATGSNASVKIECGDDEVVFSDRMFSFGDSIDLHCFGATPRLRVSKTTWGNQPGCVGKCDRTMTVTNVKAVNVVRACEPWTWPSSIRPSSDYFMTPYY